MCTFRAVEGKGEDGEGKGEGKGEEKEGGESESAVKVSGCVLHFSGVGENKSREDIKEELLQFGTVAYIDFERGKTEVSSCDGDTHTWLSDVFVCVSGVCKVP